MTNEHFGNFDFANPYKCQDCFDLSRYIWMNAKARQRGRTEEENDAYMEVTTILIYHWLTHEEEL